MFWRLECANTYLFDLKLIIRRYLLYHPRLYFYNYLLSDKQTFFLHKFLFEKKKLQFLFK